MKRITRMGLGAGMVISILDFCSNDLSSIPAGRYVFH